MIDPVTLRREFHQYPELAFREFRTASRVIEVLQSLGCNVSYGPDVMEGKARLRTPSEQEFEDARKRAIENGANPETVNNLHDGLTGVVALCKGQNPGPTIAFRFDMDAVALEESTDIEHKPLKENFLSQYQGLMHACGHDAHTAIGLTLASRLVKGDFSGTIKLIFQPAEEGGWGGARSIVEKGILNDVNQLYCLHVAAGLDLGSVIAGTHYLATTKLEAEFSGVPAHSASAPEKGANALLGAATALLNIQSIPSYPKDNVRVNVGTLEGGTAVNIIPAYARMTIETRAQTCEINQELVERVKRIIRGSAEMHQLKSKVKIIGEAISVDCDPEVMDIVMEAARELDYQTIRRGKYANGSEDAGYLIQRVQEQGGKGTYITVGSRYAHAHHNPRFDLDEEVLVKSVDLLEKIARRVLAASNLK